jgi:hypothetical protein
MGGDLALERIAEIAIKAVEHVAGAGVVVAADRSR